MRVIAGMRRGMKLAEFEGSDIRPTTDRVKENIFNIISPYVPEAKVLDMFAGTGALSIEAVSRGAKSALLCELSESSAKIARTNLEKADFGDVCKLMIGDSVGYVEKTEEKFDIVFLDPPYNTGLLKKALDAIAQKGVLEEDGIVVAECDGPEYPSKIEGLVLSKQKKYGRSYILIYELA